MKHLPALLLSLLLLAGIAVPSVLAESLSAESLSRTAASSAAESAADIAASSSSGEDAAAPQHSSGVLTARTVQNAAAQAAVNSATALHFQDLRAILLKYNNNILSLQASLGDLSETSTSDLEKAVALLETQSSGIQQTLAQLTLAAENPELSDQRPIDNALIQSLGMNQASLKSQIISLESQINSLDTTLDTSKNTMNNAINQIIKGAESLYIGIVTMDTAASGIRRNISALDRAVAIREKQLELGMASAYDVETIKYQRSQAQSGLISLEFQIKTSKINLESMCGMELNGTVMLDSLTPPTAEELKSVSYDANVKAAAERNVDVMNAEVKRTNDKETGYKSLRKAYDAAVSSFACKYKVLCLTVAEKDRLAQAAQTTVDYNKRTFSISQEKYERGMVSYEEYQSAKDTLSGSEDDLASAQLDLLTAYRNYVWATEYGIA